MKVALVMAQWTWWSSSPETMSIGLLDAFKVSDALLRDPERLREGHRRVRANAGCRSSGGGTQVGR